MKLEIITPEALAFEGEVDSVVLPGADGQIGILPGHLPLVTLLEAGEVEAVTPRGTDYLAIAAGFAEVVGDHISVLTEAAIDVDEIDEAAVEQARQRAKEELERAKEQNLDPMEVERLEGSLRFAIAQQLAKGRRR